MAARVTYILLLSMILFGSASLAGSAQVMPPGGAGGGVSIYEAARSVYYKDGDLDKSIVNLTARMRNGSITYQESEGRLNSYYQSAIKRSAYWEDNFSPSQNEALYRAVDNMLKLQVQRCYELLDATKYERKNGYDAAKWKWDAEISTYNRYKTAVKKVGRLL